MTDDDFDPEYDPEPELPDVERCRRCGYYRAHLTYEDLCSRCHDATYPRPIPKDPTHDRPVRD